MPYNIISESYQKRLYRALIDGDLREEAQFADDMPINVYLDAIEEQGVTRESISNFIDNIKARSKKLIGNIPTELRRSSWGTSFDTPDILTQRVGEFEYFFRSIKNTIKRAKNIQTIVNNIQHSATAFQQSAKQLQSIPKSPGTGWIAGQGEDDIPEAPPTHNNIFYFPGGRPQLEQYREFIGRLIATELLLANSLQQLLQRITAHLR